MCGSGCWIGHRRLTTFPSPRSPPDRAPCCQLCVCSQVLPAATEPLRFLLQEESHSLGSPGGPRQDAASLPRILGSEMVSLGSSFPREGGRQDSPPAQEERGAEEAERTVGQGCLSSGPWGCASFPPHQPLNTPPLWLTILILIKDRWGLAGRNVTMAKALSSGNRVRGHSCVP